jgi:hypothetical protein
MKSEYSGNRTNFADQKLDFELLSGCGRPLGEVVDEQHTSAEGPEVFVERQIHFHGYTITCDWVLKWTHVVLPRPPILFQEVYILGHGWLKLIAVCEQEFADFELATLMQIQVHIRFRVTRAVEELKHIRARHERASARLQTSKRFGVEEEPA